MGKKSQKPETLEAGKRVDVESEVTLQVATENAIGAEATWKLFLKPKDQDNAESAEFKYKKPEIKEALEKPLPIKDDAEIKPTGQGAKLKFNISCDPEYKMKDDKLKSLESKMPATITKPMDMAGKGGIYKYAATQFDYCAKELVKKHKIFYWWSDHGHYHAVDVAKKMEKWVKYFAEPYSANGVYSEDYKEFEKSPGWDKYYNLAIWGGFLHDLGMGANMRLRKEVEAMDKIEAIPQLEEAAKETLGVVKYMGSWKKLLDELFEYLQAIKDGKKTDDVLQAAFKDTNGDKKDYTFSDVDPASLDIDDIKKRGLKWFAKEFIANHKDGIRNRHSLNSTLYCLLPDKGGLIDGVEKNALREYFTEYELQKLALMVCMHSKSKYGPEKITDQDLAQGYEDIMNNTITMRGTNDKFQEPGEWKPFFKKAVDPKNPGDDEWKPFGPWLQSQEFRSQVTLTNTDDEVEPQMTETFNVDERPLVKILTQCIGVVDNMRERGNEGEFRDNRGVSFFRKPLDFWEKKLLDETAKGTPVRIRTGSYRDLKEHDFGGSYKLGDLKACETYLEVLWKVNKEHPKLKGLFGKALSDVKEADLKSDKCPRFHEVVDPYVLNMLAFHPDNDVFVPMGSWAFNLGELAIVQTEITSADQLAAGTPPECDATTVVDRVVVDTDTDPDCGAHIVIDILKEGPRAFEDSWVVALEAGKDCKTPLKDWLGQKYGALAYPKKIERDAESGAVTTKAAKQGKDGWHSLWEGLCEPRGHDKKLRELLVRYADDPFAARCFLLDDGKWMPFAGEEGSFQEYFNKGGRRGDTSSKGSGGDDGGDNGGGGGDNGGGDNGGGGGAAAGAVAGGAAAGAVAGAAAAEQGKTDDGAQQQKDDAPKPDDQAQGKTDPAKPDDQAQGKTDPAKPDDPAQGKTDPAKPDDPAQGKTDPAKPDDQAQQGKDDGAKPDQGKQGDQASQGKTEPAPAATPAGGAKDGSQTGATADQGKADDQAAQGKQDPAKPADQGKQDDQAAQGKQDPAKPADQGKQDDQAAQGKTEPAPATPAGDAKGGSQTGATADQGQQGKQDPAKPDQAKADDQGAQGKQDPAKPADQGKQADQGQQGKSEPAAATPAGGAKDGSQAGATADQGKQADQGQQGKQDPAKPADQAKPDSPAAQDKADEKQSAQDAQGKQAPGTNAATEPAKDSAPSQAAPGAAPAAPTPAAGGQPSASSGIAAPGGAPSQASPAPAPAAPSQPAAPAPGAPSQSSPAPAPAAPSQPAAPAPGAPSQASPSPQAQQSPQPSASTGATSGTASSSSAPTGSPSASAPSQASPSPQAQQSPQPSASAGATSGGSTPSTGAPSASAPAGAPSQSQPQQPPASPAPSQASPSPQAQQSPQPSSSAGATSGGSAPSTGAPGASAPSQSQPQQPPAGAPSQSQPQQPPASPAPSQASPSPQAQQSPQPGAPAGKQAAPAPAPSKPQSQPASPPKQAAPAPEPARPGEPAKPAPGSTQQKSDDVPDVAKQDEQRSEKDADVPSGTKLKSNPEEGAKDESREERRARRREERRKRMAEKEEDPGSSKTTASSDDDSDRDKRREERRRQRRRRRQKDLDADA